MVNQLHRKYIFSGLVIRDALCPVICMDNAALRESCLLECRALRDIVLMRVDPHVAYAGEREGEGLREYSMEARGCCDAVHNAIGPVEAPPALDMGISAVLGHREIEYPGFPPFPLDDVER